MTPDMQPEELSEDELMDINEESGCDKKDEDVPEEVMSAINFTLKELLEIFYNIKGAKNEMLAVSQKYRQVWKFTRYRKDALYHKLYDKKKAKHC